MRLHGKHSIHMHSTRALRQNIHYNEYFAFPAVVFARTSGGAVDYKNVLLAQVTMSMFILITLI